MDYWLFLRGAVLGFSIAAPVGPIGVLVIRHSLAWGRAAGLTVGLGAAAADACYGLVGGLGVSAVSAALAAHAVWLRLGGGAFLVWLGVRTAFASPVPVAGGGSSGAGRFLLGLVLTLSNPMTILSFAAMFAGLGVAGASGRPGSVGILVAGVFLGSAAWWVTLSGVTSLARGSMTPARMRWINRVSGFVVAVFGAAAMVAGVEALR